jgi:CheY-like chemotaxis protein
MSNSDIQKHVLVVDDEQEVAAQIKRVLVSSFNCTVDVAYNGKEALDKLRTEEHYNLLVLDILVPKLNGIEVCEFMIQDQKLRQIPTLLISILPLNSNDFQKSLVKFEEFAVVKDVLEKPFSDRDLLAKVKKIIKPNN